MESTHHEERQAQGATAKAIQARGFRRREASVASSGALMETRTLGDHKKDEAIAFSKDAITRSRRSSGWSHHARSQAASRRRRRPRRLGPATRPSSRTRTSVSDQGRDFRKSRRLDRADGRYSDSEIRIQKKGPRLRPLSSASPMRLRVLECRRMPVPRAFSGGWKHECGSGSSSLP